MSKTLRRTGLLVAAACLAAPAGAAAAPLEPGTYYDAADGGTLTVNATTANRTILHITRSGSTVTIAGSTGGTSPSESCVSTNDGDVITCTLSATLLHLNVNLDGEGGDDQIELDSDLLDTGGEAIVNTGEGDDHFDASSATYDIQLDLGPGADDAKTGSGNDLIDGGTGNDLLDGGAGHDQVMGGDGNDALVAGPENDGTDFYTGGGDTPSEDDPQAGDTLTYYSRTNPVTAVLPDSDGVTMGNGEAGEDDWIASIENVQGGSSVNTLTGNARNNYLGGSGAADTLIGAGGDDYLAGRGGANTMSGGEGDDQLDARIFVEDDAANGVDASLDCGPGTDRVTRDFTDPAPAGCEKDTPGFQSPTHALIGKPNVGQVLSMGSLATFGDPGTTTVHWSSCATIEYEDCRDLPDGPTFTPTAAEQGRFLYAYAEVIAPDGYSGFGNTPLTTIGAPIPATPTPAPAPAPTPAPTPNSVTKAGTALGGTARPATGLGLGTGVEAFEPAGFTKGSVTVPLTTSGTTPILALTCAAACEVTAEQTVTAGSGSATKTAVRAAATKKKTKGVTLKKQKFTLAAGAAGTVNFKASGPQRKAIGKLKKPKLVVSITVKDAAGKKHTAKKTYTLKAAKKAKGKK